MPKRKKANTQAFEPIEPLLHDDAGDAMGRPAKKRRFRWKRYRWMLWLLLLVPVVYFAIEVASLLAPRVRTEVALTDSMTDALSVQGQVVLSSRAVMGSGGTLYYTVPAGQRVAAGAEVAQVFADEAAAQAMALVDEIDEEIALLQQAQQTAAESGDLDVLMGQMQQGIYGLLDGMERQAYDALRTARNEMLLAGNRWQVSTGQATDIAGRLAELSARRTGYARQAVATGSVAAPESGYFTPAARQDRQMPSYEEVAPLSPSLLKQLIELPPSYHSQKVVGHIVTDYKWHFFTVVSAKEAEKFVVGDKSLQITFPDVGDMMLPVMVKNVVVDEERGLASVELYCEYMQPEVMQLRVENAQIVFGIEKGLKISKNALRLVDFENEDGSTTTHKGVYVRFGNMVYFRRVDILVEDDFHMLVPAVPEKGVNEVEMYDDVVVDTGGMELYDRKIL
ncbi:MAG: HlyD family efflux transporter periplasmic adaptor subunit [Oscillospiraceae bacterium]